MQKGKWSILINNLLIIFLMNRHYVQSLQDIWKCTSINAVPENDRQGFSNRFTGQPDRPN